MHRIAARVILPVLCLLMGYAGSQGGTLLRGNAAPLAGSTAPAAISYQGQVTFGGSLFTGTGSFKFALLSGTTSIWSNDGSSSGGSEPTTTVALPVVNGVFTLRLGDTSLAGMTEPLSAAIFTNPNPALRVWFAGSASGPFTQLAPDQPLASVPYALVAETVDGIDGDQIQRTLTAGCPAGQAITTIAPNGTPSCAAVLSAVAASTGLTGNGTTSSPLAVDSTTIQLRLSSGCPAGQALTNIAATGVPACAGFLTTVTTGTGLTGTGTSGSPLGIDTAAIQARLSGTCGSGTFVSASAAGGVVCDPYGGRGATMVTTNTLTTIDSTGDVGSYTSITIGTDGLPVVSYYDVTNGNLKVAKCVTTACTGSSTITTVDSAGDVGQYVSITIGADGLPVISYYNASTRDLKVAKCVTAACTGSATITTVDSAGDVGLYTSITIGTDGIPIVSYHDGSAGTLKVAKCVTSACTGSATITVLDSTGVVGYYTSIAIGADGLPVISYYDVTNGDLKVAACVNSACTGSATVSPVDANGLVGQDTNITIGADGLPVISYQDFTNGDLKVLKCLTAACTVISSVTIADSTGNVGRYSSITIGADGLPVISYYDVSNGDLKVVKCVNSSCGAIVRRR